MAAHILVVEDSDEVRELLVALLEDDGFSVTSSESAEQALATVRRERPDLILTDLMLGTTSGLELITRIRSDLAPPIPPIVACSGFTEFEAEASRRGAAAFIPKPFEADTIQKTIKAVLTRREVTEEEHDQASVRARSLRAAAAEAARAAVSRLAPRMEELVNRSQWTTSFLPRYFGFGEAFIAVLEAEELLVSTSSSDRVWKRGSAVDLPLCRDIMATRSAIVVPDLPTLGSIVRAPDATVLRFFAGVPLLADSVAVGALCLVDTQARSFDSEGYSVLEAFGRRGSAVLSARELEIAPMWAPSGFLTRDGFEIVLAAELSRMEHDPLSLSLFVYTGGSPGLQLYEHAATGELGEQRFGALIAHKNSAAVRRISLDFATAIASANNFLGGGLVTIEDGAASKFEPRRILRVAEALLEGVLRTAPGTVERILIGREPRLTVKPG